jgi:putative (di)nucleoside polyphosphate hydrolase
MYPFDGQKQKYFLVRLKKDAHINLNTKIPEFIRYKFVSSYHILDVISHFKKPIYQKVLNYFKKTGYL